MTDQMTAHAPVRSVLRDRREALGLSREALGAQAGGISSSTITRIEHHKVSPSRATVAALARALGCSFDELDGALKNEARAGNASPVEDQASQPPTHARP